MDRPQSRETEQAMHVKIKGQTKQSNACAAAARGPPNQLSESSFLYAILWFM
jgi:hypothetical protein